MSRFFIVGRLEVDDAQALESDVTALRAQLTADPLLQAVPSMKPDAGKTALFFHAKDDVPEVRHAVFKLLLQHELRFSAVVKEKHHLLADLRGREAANPRYRYKADGHEIYDDLMRYLHAMWPKFTRVLDLDAPTPRNSPKTKGKPVYSGVEFNEKHPLTLESRAGFWNKDREI